MEELALHILDIAENSIDAGATNLIIEVTENKDKNLLQIVIEDNGKGMDANQIKKAVDPFFTSRTTRNVGMGLSLLKHAAVAANGDMNIEYAVGKGTKVRTSFQLDHIDLQPIGNLTDTIIALILRNPETDIIFKCQKNGKNFILDTREIKKKIKETAINSSPVIRFLKEFITENLFLISKEN